MRVRTRQPIWTRARGPLNSGIVTASAHQQLTLRARYQESTRKTKGPICKPKPPPYRDDGLAFLSTTVVIGWNEEGGPEEPGWYDIQCDFDVDGCTELDDHPPIFYWWRLDCQDPVITYVEGNDWGPWMEFWEEGDWSQFSAGIRTKRDPPAGWSCTLSLTGPGDAAGHAERTAPCPPEPPPCEPCDACDVCDPCDVCEACDACDACDVCEACEPEDPPPCEPEDPPCE